MKTWIGVAVLALATGSVWAQGNTAILGEPADLGGTIYASTFAAWTVPQGNNGPLTWSYSSACNAASAGGVTFKPLTVGTPVKIVDSNTAASEVVTVTSVRPAGSGCAITVNPSNPHDTFHITTATAGLQEAINYASGRQNVVVITPEFTRAGGTTSTITSAKGSSSITILDERTALMVPYTWNGTAYVATVFPGGGGGGGTTSAAGPGGAVQLNDPSAVGTFRGSSNFVFDPTANTLSVAGGVTATGLTVNGVGSTNGLDFPEATPGTGTGGHEVLTSDSSTHTLKLSSNGGVPSDVCTADNGKCPGTAGNPAGPTNAVQINGGSTFSGSSTLTFDPSTNLFGMGGTTVQSTGNCFITGLDAYCGFIHDQWVHTHNPDGAETQAASAYDLDWIGPSSYNGFPGGAINAHNNTGKIKEYFAAQLRGAGFKRILDSSQGQGTGFAGIGDWSFDNIEAKYTNSFCCGSDESGTAFRYNMTEYFGFLQAAATAVTTANSTAPDAAGQGPFASPVTKVSVTTAEGNAGPISVGSMLGDLAGTDAGCGTAIFPVGTYPAGHACGTFTGTESAFDSSPGVGQIGITVAHGSVPSITAFGATTAAIGDQTNRYTYDVGVAQSVTVNIHGGTTGVFTTGVACIAGGTIEAGRITSVGSVSGGQQTLVINVRKYHNPGAEVMQGACAPHYSLILHDDVATFFTPYPYWIFGRVGSNLIFGVQKGGGVNYGDVFRQGSKPNAYGATWSALKSAEIIVDNSLEYTVPSYVIEDTGWVPTVGDIMVGMPFPSRRDNMYDFRDFSSNPSDQSVKSSLVSMEFGGEFGTPGAATMGYQPFSLTNTTPCTNNTYVACGGKVDAPDSAMDIIGSFGSIFRVTQPAQSLNGDRADTVLGVYPAAGADFGADYNLFTFSPNGAYGAAVWTNSSLSSDTYIGTAPDYIAGGLWNVASSYAEGAGVLYSGNDYLAVSANTGIQPGTDPTKWALVTATTGSTWNSGTSYTVGQVTGFAGQTWFALRSSTNVTPGTNADDWTILYHPPGLWQSYVGFIGFADSVKGGTHVKYGALSVDPGANQWDLGDGSYQGNISWNLALNNLTAKGGVILPSVVSAASLATDSTGKIVAGSSTAGTIVASSELVTFSATPTFSTATNVSRIVLTANITSFTLGAGADGQSKTMCFKQGVGPYTVAAPGNVHGFFTVGTVSGSWNCQAFTYDLSDSIWLASSTGLLNE